MLTVLALAAAAAAADWPAVRASKTDFRAFEAGLALVGEVQPRLFPGGVDLIDAALYDGGWVYLYSNRSDYAFPKLRRWKGYQVYRVRHVPPLPPELQWGGCRGGGGAPSVTRSFEGRAPEKFFECAPLTTFVAVQKRKKKPSAYTTRESYLATIVHEAAHQAVRGGRDHPPDYDDLIPLVDRLVPVSSDLGSRSLDEAYAQWCELSVAAERFPRHFAAMRDDYVPGWEEPHNLGMKAVNDLWDARHPPAARRR